MTLRTHLRHCSVLCLHMQTAWYHVRIRFWYTPTQSGSWQLEMQLQLDRGGQVHRSFELSLIRGIAKRAKGQKVGAARVPKGQLWELGTGCADLTEW